MISGMKVSIFNSSASQIVIQFVLDKIIRVLIMIRRMTIW